MLQLWKVVLGLCIARAGGAPHHEPHGSHGPHENNFIGEGTHEIASALLQGFVHEDSNMVFSPLGYSTVLAIFAEGARGPSREEIATALHFPDDMEMVREAYRSVLERLSTKKRPDNTPEFKNWFYIYKNYTVEQELQDTLRKYYFTEVKSVDRPEEFGDNHTEDKPTEEKPTEEKPIEEKPTEEKPTEEKPIEEKPTEEKPTEEKPTEEKPIEEKPIEEKPTEEKPTEDKNAEDMPSEDKNIENKPIEDKNTEDKPFENTPTEDKPTEVKMTEDKHSEVPDVEKTAIEMAESAHQIDSEEAPSNNHQGLLADKPDKPDKPDKLEKDKPEEEKTTENVKDTDTETEAPLPGIQNNAERVQLGCVEEQPAQPEEMPVHKQEGEMMVAMQRRTQRGFSSMDHFSGMTDSSLKIKGRSPLSQMIIFNGMYYRGDWMTPFVKKPAHDSRVFYKSEKEKITVSTIHSEGVFKAGEISSLDSRAIELPYKGGRYSLLILVPNSRDGLTKLIADLSGYPLSKVLEQMSDKSLDVCLPTFEIDTISKPISSFSKLGLSKVTSIFDPEKADLSGISKADPGLYVEELVQMVTFKVDADYSDANHLTASLASSRTEFERFQINQPFLFFLRDNVEDMVIVNGKILDPTPKPDFFES